MEKTQKIVVVGAGPVGSLAALYAAQRGHQVEVYELRPGEFIFSHMHQQPYANELDSLQLEVSHQEAACCGPCYACLNSL